MRPLLKVNAPASPSDTRPIANPCELSKILERVVRRQITDFIVANAVLDLRRGSTPSLSHFREPYGTASVAPM